MQDTVKRLNFLGLPIDAGVNADFVGQFLEQKGLARLISFVGPESWVLAKQSPAYANTLERMSLVLPESHGVAFACRLFFKQTSERLRFDTSSLANSLFTACAKNNTSIMLIGGKPGVDENMQGKLVSRHPGLKVVATEHGFGELSSKVEAVMAKAPDVIIVGMGTPRQENFLLALKDAGYKGFAITCGSFFDEYLEADPYYPAWVLRWKLESPYRMRNKPDRLLQRYVFGYATMAFSLLKALTEKWRPAALKRS